MHRSKLVNLSEVVQVAQVECACHVGQAFPSQTKFAHVFHEVRQEPNELVQGILLLPAVQADYFVVEIAAVAHIDI